MRILSIAPVLPRVDAGTAEPAVIFRQVEQAARRHAVTLAAFAADGVDAPQDFDRLRALGVELHTVVRSPTRSIGQQAATCARWLEGKMPLRPLWHADRAMTALVRHLMSQRQFDLIHVEDNVMAGHVPDTRATLCLTEHEAKPPTPSECDCALLPIDRAFVRQRWVREAINAGEARRWRTYQTAVWRRFDAIQVFTERDRALIAAMTPDAASRVQVNPFGVDEARATEPADETPATVLFAGNFLHPANADAARWLVGDIMPRVWASRADVRLTLVGASPPRSLAPFASDRVTITGRVPDVRPFLERTAVVVAPIRIGGGMRMKVIEAMAAGKAVVATPLAVEGLGRQWASLPVAVADDAAGIAAHIVGLLSAERERYDLGRRAREFVGTHCTWQAYGERLERFYCAVRGASSTSTVREPA